MFHENFWNVLNCPQSDPKVISPELLLDVMMILCEEKASVKTSAECLKGIFIFLTNLIEIIEKALSTPEKKIEYNSIQGIFDFR